MTLTFAAFREANLERCARWHPLYSWSLSDWGVAAGGEMGEALDVIKKINRARDGIKGSYATVIDLANELADTVIYIDLLAAAAGINLEEAIRDKFNAKSEKLGFPERL